jgi:GTP-binding protein EngB required for normal cell division
MKEKPSLLIIGNSNVGKTSITKLLLPNPKDFKGKTGKDPGSTLLIKSLSHPDLPFNILDLPGFGYMKDSSRRREEHTKKQLIIHIEKNYAQFFFSLIVINILRIEDELTKYHSAHSHTLPLSYELIQFLKEFKLPVLIIINKVDKVSNYHKNRIISLFVEKAKSYNLILAPLTKIEDYKGVIPYIEFSAFKKLNLNLLKTIINFHLSKKDK